MKDYYSILGVVRGATADDIKKAWRKLAHKHHPDKTGGEDQKFKEVNEAYYVLSDPERRSQYDHFGVGASGFSGSGGAGYGGGAYGMPPFGDFSPEFAAGFEDWFSDILENFFAGPGFRGPEKGSRGEKGRDVRVEVAISFEAIFSGLKQEVSLKLLRPCERCGGSAREPGTSATSCKACGGAGRLHRVEQTILGTLTRLVTCPTCHGQGEIPESACTTCKGEGRQERIERISVTIPAGVEDGETLRFAEQGEAGRASAPPGDLYVTVRILPTKRFRREGTDIWLEEEIPFRTAVLGGVLVTALPQGEIRIKIPAGTPSGKVFRLSGRGVPDRANASRKGNAFVRVEVHVPRKISERTKKLLLEMDEDRA